MSTGDFTPVQLLVVWMNFDLWPTPTPIPPSHPPNLCTKQANKTKNSSLHRPPSLRDRQRSGGGGGGGWGGALHILKTPEDSSCVSEGN